MYTEDIKRISLEILQDILLLRRELHRNPELGFQEFKTASLLAQTLSKYGLEVTSNIAKTGLTALLRGDLPGKTFAIRSDIDALQVLEQTGLDFASVNNGVMHACGHDAHMAIVLGCAKILSLLKDRIKGSVKFIFQPGEEGLGGAKYMIDERVLESPAVDAIIATHVMPSLETGCISVGTGPVMASPSEFDITIKGKGGHAAEPHKAIDPILIGSILISLFQTIITREKSPIESALISVTSFNAGNTYNVIPDTAQIKGTVRTFDPALDKMISERMEALTASLTGSMGAGYAFSYKIGYPPVVNDARISKLIFDATSKLTDSSCILNNARPSMLAEDFAYYVQKIPGAIFNLGCKAPNTDIVHNLHSSKLCIDEDCICIGMQIMAQCALDFLSDD